MKKNMILLREKRLEKELSQKELAELSGVPQQNISAYEAGSRMPGADALYALAGTDLDLRFTPVVFSIPETSCYVIADPQ